MSDSFFVNRNDSSLQSDSVIELVGSSRATSDVPQVLSSNTI
jgi:hypothetical protein